MSTTYETLAYTSETLVFLILGGGVFAFHHPYKQMGVGLFLSTLVILNVARFLNIFIVSLIVNKFRTVSIVSRSFQLVMVISGFRGAMAYALAMQSSEEVGNGDVMLLLTMGFSIITVSAVTPLI